MMGGSHFFGGHLYAVRYPSPQLGFTYPPFSALAFSPLTLVPRQPAQYLWAVANLAVLAGLLALSLRAVRPTLSGRELAQWSLVLMTPAIWLDPVKLTFSYGQVNIVLVALVLADLTGRVRLGGRGSCPRASSPGWPRRPSSRPSSSCRSCSWSAGGRARPWRWPRSSAWPWWWLPSARARRGTTGPSTRSTPAGWDRTPTSATRACPAHSSDFTTRSWPTRSTTASTSSSPSPGWPSRCGRTGSPRTSSASWCAPPSGWWCRPSPGSTTWSGPCPILIWLCLADDRPRGGRVWAGAGALLLWRRPIWSLPYGGGGQELHEHGWQLVVGSSYFFAMLVFLLGVAVMLLLRRRHPAPTPGARAARPYRSQWVDPPTSASHGPGA